MKEAEIIEILAGSLLFGGLEDRALKTVLTLGRSRAALRGELLFQEGEAATGFFVLLSGKVKVFKATFEGKEKILHILGPGEPVGEAPMFGGIPYPASAQTLEPCQLFFLPREVFIDKLKDMPELALAMLAVLSRRLRVFTTQIEHLALKEVPARLAAYLNTLKEECGGETSLVLPLSKAQLASLLGTSPETLSRILGRMVTAGYLNVTGNILEICDPEGLAQVAEEGRME
ncbi:Crp/Fnr family transcriptional regulator [Desulfobotulus sp.]|jgi:CRP/FNR family transcriptional regulator|uniref:Crp/Fnr family transcriptional regulator n=1 Tax=Desulfobotulus sp. TaxID=1940337 RepID=UPI002A35B715|nr:Crp/Fnr family transcriptional regulator [Desulfobotulus sp.]MDY0162144.1 Crp/Fnr family transcriptional regulator [Desulfobotulus sp.]